MIRALLILLLTPLLAFAGDKPTVEVYMIQKWDPKADNFELPEVILEVTNTTQNVLYVQGTSIAYPFYETETFRKGRWLQIRRFKCGTGSSMRPLRPGARMLVTLDYPMEEEQFRYRIPFYTSGDRAHHELLSSYSRTIQLTELGFTSSGLGEMLNKVEEIESDEQINKAAAERREKDKQDGEARDPFAK